MALKNSGVDSLQLFLSGGPLNSNANLSLGGASSKSRARGLGVVVNTPIPALQVENVFPACGQGDATILVDANGNLVFTAPGDTPGTPVTPIVGDSVILASGSSPNKAVRVFSESGLPTPKGAVMDMTFADILGGILSMKNVTNAQRVAGVTTYRAIMLTALSLYGVTNVRLWLPPVAALQAVYAIGTEIPSGGAIQTIPDEFTAPLGVSFSSPAVEGSALTIADIPEGSSVGLWIRKAFPASGTMDIVEKVQLAMKYFGT